MQSKVLKSLAKGSLALTILIVIGTFGYHAITENESLFDCFYMTVITLTTIGFGEIIGIEDNVPARIFTVFLAFSGVGFLSYFISTVSAVLIDGTLKENFKIKKMNKSLSDISGHYIVCGLGRNAVHLLNSLISSGGSIVAIDIDNQVLNEMAEKYPQMLYVHGNASDDIVLEKAGITRAKGLFASTSDDSLNLVISLSARRLNPEVLIVGLCKDHSNMEKLKIAGADSVVSTNLISAQRLVSEMLRPAATEMLDLLQNSNKSGLNLEQFELNEKFEGQTIGDLLYSELKGIHLVAIKTKGKIYFRPPDDFKVSKGDTAIIITTPDTIAPME